MNNLTNWLQRRLDRTTPNGLKLTVSLAIAGLLLAFFAGILQGTHETSTVSGFDKAVGQAIIGLRNNTATVVFEIFTGIAGVKGSILMLILSTILLIRKPYRQLPVILITGVAVSTAIVVIVKLLVERHRPNQALQIIHEASFSFPSGHTMAAVVLYGLVAYFIMRTFKSFSARSLVIGTWVLFVVAVAISRIYLGVHYPSDTLASASLGAAGLSLGLAWLTRHATGLDPASFTPYARSRLFIAFLATVVIVSIWRQFFV